jgi:hypothetical protein
LVPHRALINDLKTKRTINLLLQPRHTSARSETARSVIQFLTLCSHLSAHVPGVEAVMANIINEVLLYCCGAAFITGIVVAAASLIS